MIIRIVTPSQGLSTTRSMRSENSSGKILSSPSLRRILLRRARSSSSVASGTQDDQADGSERSSVSLSMPCLRTAIVSTTGTPSSRERSSALSSIPRRRARSIMLTATTAGSFRRCAAMTSLRPRLRFVASSTQTTRSGLRSPRAMPLRTSTVTFSSGERG